MTQAPIPETLLPNVPEETETEILKEIAAEWTKDVYTELDDAYPNYVLSPAVQLPPRERLEKYMLRIWEAYPQDEAGRLMELNNLLNTDYIDLYKAGLAPAPLSMPWAVLVHVPKIFKRIQQDFRQAYKTWADRTLA